MTDIIEKYQSAALSAQATWLEDTLEKLLEGGLQREQIAIQMHPNSRVVVCVDGEPRYEWTLKIVNQQKAYDDAK